MTAPLVTVTVEQAQAAADALLDLMTGTHRIHDSSGHRPFCWCHNHADADGVFHWTAELPALRFPPSDPAPNPRESTVRRSTGACGASNRHLRPNAPTLETARRHNHG